MIAVFYDDDCAQLWVSTRPDPFPPRTLVASQNGDQILITRCVGTNIVAGATFDQFAQADGTGFADAASALAYLQGEFVKTPLAPANFFPSSSYEQIAYQDGAMTLNLPSIPGQYRCLSINGLRQSFAAFGVDGPNVVIPADLHVMAGDLVAFEYSLI